MNPPPRQGWLDLLFDTLLDSDDDELPLHDAADDYLQADFALLFDSRCSSPRESLAAWLPCLPPLAREMYEMTLAVQPVDVMLARVADSTRKGREVTAVDSLYGRSVLHWACMLAHPELAQWLLHEGAAGQLNLRDRQGQTPLGCLQAYRTHAGSAQLIDALLSAGAALDALPHGGAELLYRKDLSVSLVRRLLLAGVDVDGGGAFGSTPLASGCGSVNWGAASLLLEFGASVLRRSASGMSVLHNSRLPVWLAEQYRRRGVDVNATDSFGETPLMLACAEGNLPFVRWLLSHGARLDAISAGGRSVAEYAAAGGPAVAGWLLRQGPLAPAALSVKLPTS